MLIPVETVRSELPKHSIVAPRCLSTRGSPRLRRTRRIQPSWSIERESLDQEAAESPTLCPRAASQSPRVSVTSTSSGQAFLRNNNDLPTSSEGAGGLSAGALGGMSGQRRYLKDGRRDPRQKGSSEGRLEAAGNARVVSCLPPANQSRKLCMVCRNSLKGSFLCIAIAVSALPLP